MPNAGFPEMNARLMRRRTLLHGIAVAVSFGIAYHFAAHPMWWMLSVYSAAWLACGGLYLVAVFLWETAIDRVEARVRRNMEDERMRDDLYRYRRRLRVVRAIHRSRERRD
jgi:uncharacterized membrane protein